MKRADKIKRITVNDVARAAKVSIATVSYVLSGREGVSISAQTRDRVILTAQELGYRRNGLAAALRTGRLNTIGIVCPVQIQSTVELQQNTYISNSLLALTTAAARRGMNTVLFFGNESSDVSAEDLADGRVDGVIVLWGLGRESWLKALGSTRLPYVEIGSEVGNYSVSTDDEQGAMIAVRHLFELGHTELCYLCTHADAPFADRRLYAFRKAVSQVGASFIQATEVRQIFVRKPMPSAVVCYNDECAVSALRAANALGLSVPGDISIVGFDDDLRAVSTSPQLTTIRNPMDEIANGALDLVLKLVDGEVPERSNLKIPTQMVIRDSTALAPRPRSGHR